MTTVPVNDKIEHTVSLLSDFAKNTRFLQYRHSAIEEINGKSKN